MLWGQSHNWWPQKLAENSNPMLQWQEKNVFFTCLFFYDIDVD